MDAPVRLEDLTVEFDSFKALEGVTHAFEPGTVTAVIGVNGSGKTTMLESIAGLQRPTSGRVIGAPDRLGYVCQHLPSVWMPLTAGEVIAMGRYRERGLMGRLRGSDRAAISEAAARLDVTHLSHRNFGDLSGGQQQRVRIAQVLASAPEMILLDEPVTGLDIPSQDRILGVIEDYSEQGAAVVITTHHLDEARHCDSVMLLENRLVACGTPEEMLTPERIEEAFGEHLRGDHAHHGHDQSLIVLDEHGAGHHGRDHGAHDHGDDGHGHGHGRSGYQGASNHHGTDCPPGPHGHSHAAPRR